jgi:hypothetical protein
VRARSRGGGAKGLRQLQTAVGTRRCPHWEMVTGRATGRVRGEAFFSVFSAPSPGSSEPVTITRVRNPSIISDALTKQVADLVNEFAAFVAGIPLAPVVSVFASDLAPAVYSIAFARILTKTAREAGERFGGRFRFRETESH